MWWSRFWKVVGLMILFYLIPLGIIRLTGHKISITEYQKTIPQVETIEEIVEGNKVTKITLDSLQTDWETFRRALITTESSGLPRVENERSGAYGLYQILPSGGYLDAYNKWNETSYTIEDLENVELQHEIFDYVQNRMNPGKSLKKALTVHNPRAMRANSMSEYEYQVMYWFYRYECEILCEQLYKLQNGE